MRPGDPAADVFLQISLFVRPITLSLNRESRRLATQNLRPGDPAAGVFLQTSLLIRLTTLSLNRESRRRATYVPSSCGLGDPAADVSYRLHYISDRPHCLSFVNFADYLLRPCSMATRLPTFSYRLHCLFDRSHYLSAMSLADWLLSICGHGDPAAGVLLTDYTAHQTACTVSFTSLAD